MNGKNGAAKAGKPVAENNGLIIKVKPPKPLHIELDLDALSFADVMVLQKMDASSEADMPEAMAVISKVIGMDAYQLPIRHLKPIISQVMDAIGATTDQGN
ncbi:MAG: hypothetical protein E6Q97_25410 [Desulfurellales bacterium]|nr:MAG: hypothetical protein E6Q97_25410 [Desulfurellales bacterium]